MTSRRLCLSPGSSPTRTLMTADATLFEPTMDDFGDVEPVDAPFKVISFPGVYALFDEGGECLYVGQSGAVSERLRAHRKKSWFPNVVSRRVLRLKGAEDRLVRETVLILAIRPRNNRAIKIGLNKIGQIHEMQFVRFGKKTKTP